MIAQHGVFPQREIQDQPGTVAIFGNIADPEPFPAAGDIVAKHRLAAHADFPGLRMAHSGDRIRELRLAVAVNADDTQHFPRSDLEADSIQRLNAAIIIG